MAANPTDQASRSTTDADRDRTRGAWRVRPALLRQRRRPQADRSAAADVAETVVRTEAASVVGAGHEDRSPATGGRLQVLDRDQLAAPGNRGAAAADPTAEPHHLAVPQGQRGGAERDAGADPEIERV